MEALAGGACARAAVPARAAAGGDADGKLKLLQEAERPIIVACRRRRRTRVGRRS